MNRGLLSTPSSTLCRLYCILSMQTCRVYFEVDFTWWTETTRTTLSDSFLALKPDEFFWLFSAIFPQTIIAIEIATLVWQSHSQIFSLKSLCRLSKPTIWHIPFSAPCRWLLQHKSDSTYSQDGDEKKGVPPVEKSNLRKETTRHQPTLLDWQLISRGDGAVFVSKDVAAVHIKHLEHKKNNQCCPSEKWLTWIK